MQSHNRAIIVLAAGSSSRLGQAKQLVCLNNKPLIQRQCELALEITPQVYCVLGFNKRAMAKALSGLPITLVEHDDWQQGMGSSISAGVSALPESVASVMLLLVDQWALTVHDLHKLYQAHETHNNCIIQSAFPPQAPTLNRLNNDDPVESISHEENQHRENQCYGPPVIFPKRLFTNLIRLTGKQGARTIISPERSSTVSVSIPHAGIDLDTSEQLLQLQHYDKYKKDKLNLHNND